MALTQKKQISVSIAIPFIILAFVFGILVWKKYHDTARLQPELPPSAQTAASVRTGVLFFADADGVYLVREGRELDPCGDQNDCLVNLLEELFSGPIGDLGLPIPETTALVSATMEGNNAFIHLNQEFADNLLSGSNAEMLAVYSIVNTVAVNFPQVAAVKLSIAGNPASVLNHLDLREPLPPDFSLENQPAASSKVPAVDSLRKDKP